MITASHEFGTPCNGPVRVALPPNRCFPSRRQFLSSVAAIGASAALAPGAVVADTPPDPRFTLIDVHHHIIPQFYFDAVRHKLSGTFGWSGWSVRNALDQMDRHRIDAAIVSYTTPGVWLGETGRSRALARRCNEFAAQMTENNPRRFGFFAALPLPDAEGSLRELVYSLDTLKADGIGLMTSYGAKWLGDPDFAEVFDELNRRKAIVYVHPTAPACCGSLMPHVPPNVVEFVQDTNRAIASLLFSGSFARYRNIRFVFSHAGGSMPTLAGRVAQISKRPQHAGKFPNGVEFELKRLYYELANSAHRPAMAALTSLVPISQILFGSDFPFVPIAATTTGLGDVGLTPVQRKAIARDNALALFPRLKS